MAPHVPDPLPNAYPADIVLAHVRLLDRLASPWGPHSPFARRGSQAASRMAFEPGPGAWDELAQSPSLDAHRLLARPWRGPRPQETAFLPGRILLNRACPIEAQGLDTCLLNAPMAVRHLSGMGRADPADLEGRFALDAGPC